MSQERQEYENMKLLWFWEQSFYNGEDYGFRNDPDYLKWAEDRREEDKQYQIDNE